jgi:murein DD-endopeptidase MepM/ murein hydrolase activator NlpD
MKKTFLYFALSGFLFANVDTQIAKNQDILRQKSQIERSIARKLNEVAKEILDEQAELEKITEEIERLSISIEKNKNLIKDKEENLEDLTQQNTKLINSRKELEEKIVKIIAQDFSFYLISDKDYLDSEDSILVEEVLEKMDIIMRKEFAKLSREYKSINSKIDTQASQIEDLKKSIEELKDEKVQKSSLKKRQENIIATLDKKKREYKQQLERIEEERQALRKTLEQLKIVKEQEAEEKRRQEEMQRALKEQNVGEKVTVRQIGSSYQGSQYKKYHGSKTIAPLEDFTVKRKFGNYIDPIYKIKIFNESVILSSNVPNAKVQNVLDGKVIYAKDTAVLEKVVIVENSYGIHTIYAHLSKIAPTIKVGEKIRKGYVIGRVEQDLTFEVTQKNYHIDPLELITVK